MVETGNTAVHQFIASLPKSEERTGEDDRAEVVLALTMYDSRGVLVLCRIWDTARRSHFGQHHYHLRSNDGRFEDDDHCDIQLRCASSSSSSSVTDKEIVCMFVCMYVASQSSLQSGYSWIPLPASGHHGLAPTASLFSSFTSAGFGGGGTLGHGFFSASCTITKHPFGPLTAPFLTESAKQA